RLESVFIDLRMDSVDQSPVPLLQHLSRRRGNRIPVIAIAERGYGREWAGLADSAVHGHLEAPIQASQVTKIAADRQVLHSFQAPPLPAHPRAVETSSISFRTYTSDMYAMLDQLVMMASHDVTLLLIGETGTGKSTIARMIHELSPRRNEMFLTVASGALPPDLIESELFGHVKGAFTSADRTKMGKFEAAHSGSLLLDEIDTLHPDQQAKLLRVIETGEFEPVGSNETIQSRTRLIVASNVDLHERMEQGEFRPDLYYRLNVLEFYIPPLRERPADVVPLTLSFVHEFCSQHNIQIRRIHPEFLIVLKRHTWPGNIRELKNHVRRAVLFCRTGELTPNDLALNLLKHDSDQPANGTMLGSTLSEKVARTEREILEEALKAHDSNRTATARALGISRVGLYKKMKKYGMIESRNGRKRSSK
ncbi:MAG: sigma-54 dependent transcriptional regulator, partial [Pirellulaceae bacterium]|nr:sigma-54 dependent transcriptional regulator [Pirellulaceae bacterium]